MRVVPGIMTARWMSGDYVGVARPIARVSVHTPVMRTIRNSAARNLFASFMFSSGSLRRPVELPNVKSVEWDRDVDNDAASCTITFYNTRPLEVGQAPSADLDQPGYYTYNRGTTIYSSRWGHQPNEWQNKLMPDNVLTTYEGYGFDPEEYPDDDPNLMKTGEWMIDEVEYTSDGLIVVSCRDYGRLLHEQIAMPPVVPFRAGFENRDVPYGAYSYPVGFQGQNTEPIITKTRIAAVSGSAKLSPHSSSAEFYTSGAVYGRRLEDAFDDDSSTWWLSTGNARPDQGYSFEWVQGSVKNQTIDRVRARVKGGPYTVYLGIYANGSWQGSRIVPYDPDHPASAPNDSDRPYVQSKSVDADGWVEFDLKDVENVTRIRLTFGGLWNSKLGTFPYRAAVRRFEAYVAGGSSPARTNIDVREFQDRNYEDYTDIAQLFAGWGGFYRASNASSRRRMDNSVEQWTHWDLASLPFPTGGVHGDWQQSGTAGPSPIPPSVFDKKPLVDCISYVRDILGFIFHVDEHGGIVFRAPNIYRIGNRLRQPNDSLSQPSNTLLVLDERQVLMDLKVRLSSKNIREKVFVANGNGTTGHIARGWNPNPVRHRRVAGWTDQNFATEEECLVMAEMIALRQLFTYRTDTITIPGYPALQVDDQVRVMERVTSEGFVHYVRGISSKLDMESGEYTYELSTHWLGERPFSRWAYDPAQMSDLTQRYLRGLYG